MSYLVYSLNNRSIEELTWTAGVPFPIMLVEIKAVKMTDNTGHGHGAVAPRLPKGEIEFVILDISITSNVFLYLV